MKVALKKQWILFCYALSFFSRFPVSQSINFQAFPFHLGNAYLPLVGVIHAICWGSVYYLAQMMFDNNISVILMLCAGVLFTGAFHEDGFADSCDGFGGGYNKQQCLAIMKDSQIGSYGTLALILLFALKINLLIDLSLQHSEQEYLFFFIVLINAAVLSRFSAMCLMQSSEYARNEASKATHASHRLPKHYFFAALLLSLLPLCFLPFLWSVVIVGVLAMSTLLCRAFFNQKLGGYSGDCLGFTQQLNELLILLMVVALSS